MKKNKPAEWKDTRFPFSAEYNYSLFVRNRCVFFYCLARNVRKMINYAANFVHPAAICVIYVYGAVKHETVKKLLSEKPWHILLLIASGISNEDIGTTVEYRKWLEALKTHGFLKITKQGVPKNKYNKVLVGTEYGDEPSERWFEYYNQPEWEGLYSVYTEGVELMKRHREAAERIASEQRGRLDVLANFSTVETVSGLPEVHDGELLNIIRKLYPYGVEVDTTDETAVKLLKIKKLVAAAFDWQITADVEKLGIVFDGGSEQLCLWDTATVGASECLEFLKKYCSQAIAEKGCFNISRLWYSFSKPPYGAYECNWYDYIFAAALRDYNKSDYFFGFGYNSERIVNEKQRNVNMKYKSGFVFVQNERQEEFRLILAKLFDIENPAETTQNVCTQARSWIIENIKWTPLDCIDHRFHEIFVDLGNTPINQRAWDICQQDWYEFGYEKYLPWLKENFDDLYGRIRRLDENFHNALAEKYGQKLADFYCEHHTVKGGAVGWLHTKNMLEESVKSYMGSVICCECGRAINNTSWAEGAHIYQASEPGEGEIIDFTLKDIIGINKKLLGRNRGDNYLCIPCLAEYTEHSEIELGHLVHDFKEQGCELF